MYLNQFNIIEFKRICNKYFDFSFTNNSLYILLSISLITILCTLIISSLRSQILLNNPIKLIIEKTYIKIEEIVTDIITINSNKYIPLIFTLFFFILFNNLIGLIPYSFTTTSHIIVTLFFSLTIIISTTLIGIKKHGIIKFMSMFIPAGLSKGKIKIIIPLIFLIEFISYFFRILSLSVRLAANMICGHVLLKIVSSFGLKYTLFKPYILLILPVCFVFGLLILEFAVSIIQAYVFTLLTTIYIKDVELLH